ncbi:MAG: hypothetical protein OXF43_09355 [Gammaproteobacteria bacterium]|nr:hypothetical protein [Gammaproteobacteria bacterium]MCY4297292.1 hypothetical protein [Gammaproteobacteria bacterium]
MEEILIPTIVPAIVFGSCIAIVWLILKFRQLRVEKQAEIQQQLLTKFESAGELSAFLDTDSGQQFMRQFESNPHRMVLAMLSLGIVFSFLGLGFLALTAASNTDFLYPGIILLVLGIGFATAAAVSRRLSAQWQRDDQLGG